MIRDSPQHIAYYNMQSKQEFEKALKLLVPIVWIIAIFGISDYFLTYLFPKINFLLPFYFCIVCILYVIYYYFETKREKKNRF